MPKTIEERVALLENIVKTQHEQIQLLSKITDKHQKALLDISKILDVIAEHSGLTSELFKEILENK